MTVTRVEETQKRRFLSCRSACGRDTSRVPTSLTFPGVYVEEIPSGVRTIEGVSTSVTALIGAARKGSFDKAVLITSFSEFTGTFGALHRELELGYAVRQFFLNGGKSAHIVRVPRDATLAKFKQALRVLHRVDDVNLLTLPGVTDPKVLTAAETFCRQRRAFLITDSPPTAKSPAEMLQAQQSGMLLKSSYAAVYYPWLKIQDPLTRKLRVTPPSGTIAGVFARTDETRGVWKAPAGTEATLKGVDSLEYELTEPEAATLNAKGINCLRTFAASGPVVWGARTLEGDNALGSEWKYVPLRRLELFIEESIDKGTKWAVFEPNAEPLWIRLRVCVENFLLGLWQQGALMGQTPRYAFFVNCDRTTTGQADINTGFVSMVIGFAPLKPAEFIILRIRQRACEAE